MNEIEELFLDRLHEMVFVTEGGHRYVLLDLVFDQAARETRAFLLEEGK